MRYDPNYKDQIFREENGRIGLGEIIGIPLSQMVMVGDSDNDLPALTKTGLSIAMANGEVEVKAVCDMTTKADNNSGGCAEAIRAVLAMNERRGPSE